jgi:hypothetical protein
MAIWPVSDDALSISRRMCGLFGTNFLPTAAVLRESRDVDPRGQRRFAGQSGSGQ